MMAVLLITAFAFSQNRTDKWYFGAGFSATDHTSVNGIFDGYFDTDDYDFVYPKITLARSIAKNLAVDLQVSGGNVDNKRLRLEDEFFLLAGLGLRWTPFSESQSLKWFDPYVRIGANYHKYSYDGIEIDEANPYTAYDNGYKETYELKDRFSGRDDNFVLNGGVGINFWFTKNFGLNIESQYNWVTNYSENYADFFQHTASVVFRFGGKKAVVAPVEVPVTPVVAVKDRDGDGIPDNEDRCPDAAGPAKFQGCPDTDGDGIPDIDDKCPTVPGPKSNNGCPVTKTDVDVVLKDINFKFNSAEITPESKASINKAVKLLADSDILANGAYIDGHTDRVGSQTYNQTLSKKRAQSVVDALVNAGVDRSKLTARGFGKAQLKCTDADVKAGKETQENCDYINRRVEILPKDIKVKVEAPAKKK